MIFIIFFIHVVAILMGLAVLLILCPDIVRCKIGLHDWRLACTCATMGKTGRLPGDIEMRNGQGHGGYRYERSCRCCDRVEYQNFKAKTYVLIPGYEGRSLFSSRYANLPMCKKGLINIRQNF